MAKKGKTENLDLGSSINLERLPGETETIDFNGIQVSVDEDKVERIQKELMDQREEMRKKLYAVPMDSECFGEFKNYIISKAEWNSTESLGIVEISKAISRIEKEGIKDNMVYMNSLTLEASHYFVSKSKGTGLEEAKNFLKLYKPLDIALNDVKEDNGKMKEIEQRLAAAQQGIEMA